MGLLIAVMIVIGLTDPGSAQAQSAAPSDHNRNLFAQCMQDWGQATHMTKAQWANACQPVLHKRLGPARALQVFQSDIVEVR
jgi:hypothetical protein